MAWQTTVREAWRSVTSARRAAASSVTIITLCLTILGVIGLVALAVDREADEARRWISVEVFLREQVPDEAIPGLRAALVRLPTVRDARLVTKQEAVERFREFFDPSLIGVLETNPLPRSLLVTLTDDGRSPGNVRELVETVSRWPEVEAVQADIEWLTMLNRLVAGVVIVLVLLLLSVGAAVSIVIARTIGLGIQARLDVVEVQRTLGAPEWFVRRPFVLVGLGQGLAGGALAGLLVLAGSYLVGFVPLVGDRLGGHIARATAAGLVVLGALLGWWGSRSALATTLPPDPWVEPPERRRS